MNLPAHQYFLLVVPSCLILIGSVFIAGHFLFKAPRFLLWMGIAYILPSIALGIQSLMTNQQLTMTAPWVGTLYLTGAWATAHGIALKAKSSSNLKISLLLILVGVFTLGYFAYVDENLWLRILTINIITILLQVMIIPSVYAFFKRSNILNKMLCISYFVVVFYSVTRFLITLFYLKNVESISISSSNWWLMILALNILLCIWCAILIVATTIKELFTTLNNDRYKDVLTGLYNRRGFLEKVNALALDENIEKFYLIMCDIDYFKKINDTWGHIVGDEILKAIADVLKESLRPHDILARFGGEEFIILLSCPNDYVAMNLADRIRNNIQYKKYTKYDITVTASFGLAEVFREVDFMETLQLADQRLYSAKNNGRNRVCYR